MSVKDTVVIVKPKPLEDVSQDAVERIPLRSGRQIVVHGGEAEELISIVEPGGEISLTVRLTDAGPVFTLRGAQLKLESTRSITLEAGTINLHAQEEAVLRSEGALKIDAAKTMDLHCDDDLRVEGKIIHLN
ncbi:MAG: hypothetical protein A4E69_02919 [Syntrophus sp. PtaB.Bin138]|nr:MAG: hypothetical protein A4E69_02919 [Syntrophus sp. PtaB.Bin138]